MSKFASELTFDHSEYWSDRYANNSDLFEWYRGYDDLAPILHDVVDRSDRVLHVGAGTSALHEQMAADGFKHIENVDYSRQAINCIQQRWVQRVQSHDLHMGFRVLDARDMSAAFDPGSFDVVLDKGTLDAMLCADDDVGNASAMLQEVRRVLCEGGRYVWCTSSAPKSRLGYLEHFGVCDLSVYVLSGGAPADTVPISAPDALLQMQSAAGRYFLYVLQTRR